MVREEIELVNNISKDCFMDMIKNIFPKDRYIFAEIPSYYEDFLATFDQEFIKLGYTENMYTERKHCIGKLINPSCDLVFEFFERSALIEFFLSSNDIEFIKLSSMLEVKKALEEANINHVKIGPDKLWLEYYKSSE